MSGLYKAMCARGCHGNINPFFLGPLWLFLLHNILMILRCVIFRNNFHYLVVGLGWFVISSVQYSSVFMHVQPVVPLKIHMLMVYMENILNAIIKV